MAPHHHEGVAAPEVGSERREHQRLEGEPRLPADPLQRVDGEGLELGAHVGPGPHDPAGEVVGLLAAAADQELLAPPQVVADEAQLLPLVDEVDDLGPDVVDERDARLGDEQRPDVGVATGERRRSVDDRRRSGPDQVLGRHPVDVGVVDHGDVTGAEPLHQFLRPAVGAGGAHDDLARIDLELWLGVLLDGHRVFAPTGRPGRTSP